MNNFPAYLSPTEVLNWMAIHGKQNMKKIVRAWPWAGGSQDVVMIQPNISFGTTDDVSYDKMMLEWALSDGQAVVDLFDE